MALDESRFEALASKTLESYMDAIDDVLGDVLDVDLNNGILTIELDSGGVYIINKHAPNRQIWMSSPKSGASHYGYDDESDGWVSTKGEGALPDVLAGELAAITGTPFTL